MKTISVLLSMLLSLPSAIAGPLIIGWNFDLLEVTDTTIRIEWPDAPDGCPPTSWLVQLKVPPAAEGTPDKWITDGNYVHGINEVNIRNLYPETDYQVKVTYEGQESVTQAFTTKRSFVGGITATIVDGNDLHVSWPAQPDAIGYHLERRGGVGINIVNLSGSTLSYVENDLDAQQTYTVEVYAILPGDDRTGWSKAEVSVGLIPPIPFTARQQTAGSPTMRLNWGQVEFINNGYRIERSPWDNQSYGFLYQEPSHGMTFYDDDSADPATKYVYRIRAEESPSEVSAWIEASGWTTAPPAPGFLTPLSVSDSLITLGWSPIQGITRYAVQRAEAPFTFWEEIGTTPSNEFTDGLATDFPVLPGNTYRYRVRGQTLDFFVGDTGHSIPLDVTTPAASPSPLNATLTAPTSIAVTWDDVFGETSYLLERRSATTTGSYGDWFSIATKSAGSTAHTDNSVTSGMRYQYRLRSQNAAGSSAWALSPLVSTNAGVPVNVIATPGSSPSGNNCDDTMTLTWDAVSGAGGYIVRRTVPSDLSGGTEFVIAGGTTTSFVDTGLLGYTTYVYRVRSTFVGVESPEGVVRFARTCPWLSAGNSGTNVNLNWSEIPSPFSQYRVERRNVDSGTGWLEIATVLGSTNTSYSDTTAFGDTTYAYRIRGWAAADGGTFTPYSVTEEVTTGPPPVTGFRVTECGTNNIRLAWNQAYSASTIRILRSPAGTGSFSIIATLPGDDTTYNDGGRPAETAYDYWIFAINANGENSGQQIGPVFTKFPMTLTESDPWEGTLNWGPVSTAGVSRYRLQQDTGAGWNTIADFLPFISSNFRSLICLNSRFRVLALNSSDVIIAESLHVTYLANLVNVGLTDTGQSSTSIQLDWTDLPPNTGYRIDRRLSTLDPWDELVTLPSGTSSYLDTSLTPDTFYYYRIAILDACGGEGRYAGASGKPLDVRREWRRSWWGNDFSVLIGLGVYSDFSDFDGDGHLNLFEFLFDTDPTDPQDFGASTIEIIGGGVLQVIWPIREDLDGITLSFDLSRNLQNWVDSKTVIGPNIFGGPGTGNIGIQVPLSANINGATTGNSIFTRLRIENF